MSKSADGGSAALYYLLLIVEDTRQPWFQDNTPVISTANQSNVALSASSPSDERLPTKSTIHEMDKADQQNECRLAAVNWRTINVSTAAFYALRTVS